MRVCLTLAYAGCAEERALSPARPFPIADDADDPGVRAAPAPGDHDGSLDYAGHALPYRLHIPAGHDGAALLPLVLILHGLYADGAAMQRMTGFDEVANASGFATLYPTDESGRWSAGHEADHDVVGMLRQLVAAIARELPVDARRIYVSGFSTGALLTHVLACEAADLFAAAAPVAAPLALPASACKPARPISIMHVHGTSDTFVGYDGGGLLEGALFPDDRLPSAPASTLDWARRDRCATTPGVGSANSDWPTAPSSGAALAGSNEWVFFTPPSTPGASCAWYTGCAAGVQVGLCSHDGQHDWPSGTSSAIWSFFAQHRLP
jgi:polyhydroxybutyrate depolymerase